MANGTDTFTVGTDTNLESHTGDTGHTWSEVEGVGNDGIVREATDRLENEQSGGFRFVWKTNITPGSAEYDVEVDVNGNSGGERVGGPAGRIAGSGATLDNYEADWRNSTGQWRIGRNDGGAVTILATYTGDSPDAATRTVMLEIRDATKKVFIDSVERISSTDNTYTAAGEPGLILWSENNMHWYDNWSSTDVGGGPTNYTRTLSDSVAVIDAPVRGQLHGRVPKEPILVLTDLVARGQLHGRVVADSVSLQDTLRRYALLYRLTTDSFDVFDSLSSLVSGLFVRTLTDSLSVTDLVWRSQLHGRVVADALVMTDVILRSQYHGRTLTEQVALSESVFRTAYLYRLAQDGVDTYDALVKTLTVAVNEIGIVLMLLEQARPVVAVVEAAQPIELNLEPTLNTMKVM